VIFGLGDLGERGTSIDQLIQDFEGFTDTG
jgi:hypothetical protein